MTQYIKITKVSSVVEGIINVGQLFTVIIVREGYYVVHIDDGTELYIDYTECELVDPVGLSVHYVGYTKPYTISEVLTDDTVRISGDFTTHINKLIIIEESTKSLNPKSQFKRKDEPVMLTEIKAKALTLRETLRPYERYIVITALLVSLDHFILKGAMRSKIVEVGTALGNKFTTILNKAISNLEE